MMRTVRQSDQQVLGGHFHQCCGLTESQIDRDQEDWRDKLVGARELLFQAA